MRRKFLFFLILALVVTVYGCGHEEIEKTLYTLSPVSESLVTEVPPEIQELLWRDSDEVLRAAQEAYYQKYIDAGGVAIIGSSLVDDEILRMARNVVLEMTAKRPEIREALSAETGHYQILVNGRYEKDYNVPEGYPTQRTPAGWCAATYCVSNYWDHPYPPGHSRDTRVSGILETFVHEFAHAIHSAIPGQPQWAIDLFGWDPALLTLDPDFEDRLIRAYETALENGTWAGLYAEENYREYWAEGVVMWYYHVTGDQDISRDPLFEDYEAFYEAFAERDPLLVALLREWFHEASFADKGY